MHSLRVEGDDFNSYASLAAWLGTLDGRGFIPGTYRAETGTLDNTTRPYKGRKTLTIPGNDELELSGDLAAASDPMTMRAKIFVPDDVIGGYVGGSLVMLGMRDSVDYNAGVGVAYIPSTDKWNRALYHIGDESTIDAPGVRGAWHDWMLEGRNPGGATAPRFTFWFDGVRVWGPDAETDATSPMPTIGFKTIEMSISYPGAGGGSVSCALWEIVPGAATDLYSGLL